MQLGPRSVAITTCRLKAVSVLISNYTGCVLSAGALISTFSDDMVPRLWTGM